MARRPPEEPSRKRSGSRSESSASRSGGRSSSGRSSTSKRRSSRSRASSGSASGGRKQPDRTTEHAAATRRTSEAPTVEQPPPPPPSAPLAGAPGRVLRRSSEDKVIAGVAGGLGRYLSVDPVVVRIAFVILGFAGPGILLYFLGWLLIPEEREGEPVGPRPASERGVDLWVVVGVGLVGLGTILLIDRVVPWFDRITVPLFIIAIGAAVLVQGMRR